MSEPVPQGLGQAATPVAAILAATIVTALVAATPSLGQAACGTVGPDGIHACHYPAEGPTIVLAAGAGQDSRTWRHLVPRVGALGSVVTFDRPGLGRSPASDRDRTPTAIARELHEVVMSLGISGPIVLVGHSMGGVHALRYAELFPDSVRGVVLLDTPPPEFEHERMGLLTPDEREERRTALAAGRARAPSVVGRERDGATAESWTFAGLRRDVRIVAVIADRQDFGQLGSQRAHRHLWGRLSEAWLGLSDRAELLVAPQSGHMIHHDRPDFVLDVIQRVVGCARADEGCEAGVRR